MSLYIILYSILLYGAAGWLLQMVYAAVKQKKLVNRGFLAGPVCPLYGVVIAAVLVIAGGPERNIILLFLLSLILAMALEWLTGYLSVRLFGVRCWDYGKIPGNVEGYFCPPYSLCWAVLCAVTVRFIHPYAALLIAKLPTGVGIVVLVLLYALLFVDLYQTARSLKQLEPGLMRLRELLGDREKVSAHQGKKYQELLKSFTAGQRRLLKAFPGMKHPGYQTELDIIRDELLGEKQS